MKAHHCPLTTLVPRGRFLFSRSTAALLAALACGADLRAEALIDQPLEALLDVQLTTLGRRVQPEQDMVIATSVFSGDELRRAGARTVLEALAWMPGVAVERMNANLWGVSVRGDGSSLIARNTLILRDGREQTAAVAWSPTTWTMLNMPIDLVQRIEVQRGAGNTLWGANAANCVINIVTRTADSGGAGGVDVDSNGSAAANVQWGTRTATGWRTSFWATGAHQPGSPDLVRGRRDWDNQEDRAAGASAALSIDGGAEVTFDINAYNGVGASILAVARVPSRQEFRVTQREFGTRLSIPQAHDGRLEIAGYLQEAGSTTIGGNDNHRRSVEVSVQNFLRLGPHELLAGGSVHTDSTSAQPSVPGSASVLADQERLQAYVQDEWRFAENRGSVLVGAQAQRLFSSALVDNLYATTLRLRWAASPDLSLWAGVSRSETLANGTRDLQIPSFETGLRWKPVRELQVNASVFEQRYGSFQVPVTMPFTATTPRIDTRLRVRGLETDARWQATPSWNLDASMTLVRAEFDFDGSARSPLATEVNYFGTQPRNAFKGRVLYQIDDLRSFEVALRARSTLAASLVPSPGRGVIDLAYRHQLSKGVEFGTALKQANHDTVQGLRRPSIPFSYDERRTLAMWMSWGV
jgi:outer membrane receptor protein involved in Fe transport